MTWKNNALGLLVDGTMNVNVAEAKSRGVSFIASRIGLGYDQADPGFEDLSKRCASAGMPLLAVYTPLPAIDDYTQTGVPDIQIPFLKKLLTGKTFAALVVEASRYWTGFDIETGHPVRVATDANINYTVETIVRTMTKAGVKVLVGSKDSFVQTYAPSMTSWLDQFGFYLQDNSYRIKAADGTYSRVIRYLDTPVLKASVTDLRVSLPPDESKNPLVPGNAPQLKFWEATGTRFMLPFVQGWTDKAPKATPVILFNGDEAALKSYLGVITPTPQPVPDPLPDQTPVPVDPTSVETALARIVALVEGIAADVHDIRSKFS